MEKNEQQVMHRVRIHIDQEPYESPNPTTAESLYALGHVQKGLELYREMSGDQEDVPITNGTETVHLKEDEHFHSGAPKDYTIIVNGRKKVVMTNQVSFDLIVHLAFDPVPIGPNILFTVTYGHGPKVNPEGMLLEGESVKIKDGMVFSVTQTDKS
jgi:Multiubiquitin